MYSDPYNGPFSPGDLPRLYSSVPPMANADFDRLAGSLAHSLAVANANFLADIQLNDDLDQFLLDFSESPVVRQALAASLERNTSAQESVVVATFVASAEKESAPLASGPRRSTRQAAKSTLDLSEGSNPSQTAESSGPDLLLLSRRMHQPKFPSRRLSATDTHTLWFSSIEKETSDCSGRCA